MEKANIPAGKHNDQDDLALTACRPMLKRPPWEAMKWSISVLRAGCFACALTLSHTQCSCRPTGNKHTTCM